jgi:hypothetical protein
VLVRNLGQGGDLRDVKLGIAERLGVDGAGLFRDELADTFEVVRICKANSNAVLGQGVVKQVLGAAIQGSGGDDFVAGAGKRGKGERFRGLPGSHGEGGGSAFERCNALLEDVGGGVHDPRIDIAEFLEGEEARRVIGAVEDVGGGLVNGHGSRAGGGIGFLAGVDGKGAKVLFGGGLRHGGILRV